MQHFSSQFLIGESFFTLDSDMMSDDPWIMRQDTWTRPPLCLSAALELSPLWSIVWQRLSALHSLRVMRQGERGISEVIGAVGYSSVSLEEELTKKLWISRRAVGSVQRRVLICPSAFHPRKTHKQLQPFIFTSGQQLSATSRDIWLSQRVNICLSELLSSTEMINKVYTGCKKHPG